MFSVSSTEPVTPVATYADVRVRTPGPERTILPQSTAATAAAPDAGNGRFPQSDQSSRQQQAEAAPETTGTATNFAAAVIAGRLAPRPQSMDELLRRIGSAPIPEESKAKLKDLTA